MCHKCADVLALTCMLCRLEHKTFMHTAEYHSSVCRNCAQSLHTLHSPRIYFPTFKLEIFNSDLAPLLSSVLTHTSRPEFLICKCEPSVPLMAPCSNTRRVNERMVNYSQAAWWWRSYCTECLQAGLLMCWCFQRWNTVNLHRALPLMNTLLWISTWLGCTAFLYFTYSITTDSFFWDVGLRT